MNVVNAVRLDEWVRINGDKLNGARKETMSECAAMASKALGCRVTSGALGSIMRSRGMQTKRISERQAEKLGLMAEIEKLTSELLQLRRTLAKVNASDFIPDDIKELVFAGLKDEVKTAIFAK